MPPMISRAPKAMPTTIRVMSGQASANAPKPIQASPNSTDATRASRLIAPEKPLTTWSAPLMSRPTPTATAIARTVSPGATSTTMPPATQSATMAIRQRAKP